MDFSSAIRNRHVGDVCYIVGKGPSVNKLTPADFGPGPVITLNEAVSFVEPLQLNNPIYSMQQDGKPQCMVRPSQATLLLSNRSEHWYQDYEPRLVYHQTRDLGIEDEIISAVSAIEVARLFGCRHVIFLAFDALTAADARYPSGVYIDPNNSLNRFRRFGEIIKLSLKGLSATIERDYVSEPFTIITLTGGRPLPLKLCRKWVLEQTVLPSQWIVVDDGVTPLRWSQYAGADYLRREPRADDPDHTICRNMSVAMEQVKYDKVIIMEDDDWYHPTYCEETLKLLDEAPLVGERKAFYYHWPTQQVVKVDSEVHAALFKTAFSKSVYPLVQEIAASLKGPLIDMALWKSEVDKKLITRETHLAIGIKGLPGRLGTTSGWRSTRRGYVTDANGVWFEEHTGQRDHYRKMFPLMDLLPTKPLPYEAKEDKLYSWLYREGGYSKPGISMQRLRKVVEWASTAVETSQLNVVDLGCGKAELAALLPYKTYTGVDLSTYQIGENKSAPNVKFIRHSIAALPFKDASYDIAICCDVMEHIPENRVDRVLKEMFRVASAVLLVIDCIPSRLTGPDGSNLHCTVKPVAWWQAKLKRLGIVRSELATKEKLTVYLGSYYQSQGTFPDQVHGIRLRKNPDGSVWFARKNPRAEKFMDANYLRVGRSLVWHFPIAKPQSVARLKNLYRDKTCYIVGKGPSLDAAHPGLFEDGCPILCINESVHKIESLDVSDDNLFLIQQDTGIDCRPKRAIPLLQVYIKNLYPEIQTRYIFSDTDFSRARHSLTVLVAIAAARHMGCSRLVLISFDACVTRATGYATCVGHKPTKTHSGGEKRFLTHRKRILAEAKELPIEWVLPTHSVSAT